MKKQLVLVEALVPGADPGAHPEHPIYIPITPPPDSGLHPEHPIYVPVHIWGGGNEPFPTPPIHLPPEGGETPGDPPGTWGGAGEPFPTPPIFIPIVPDGDLGIWGPDDPRPNVPIYLPITPPIVDLPPIFGLDDEQKQKLLEFLTGNLPPYDGPDTIQPVSE